MCNRGRPSNPHNICSCVSQLNCIFVFRIFAKAFGISFRLNTLPSLFAFSINFRIYGIVIVSSVKSLPSATGQECRCLGEHRCTFGFSTFAYLDVARFESSPKKCRCVHLTRLPFSTVEAFNFSHFLFLFIPDGFLRAIIVLSTSLRFKLIFVQN